MCFVGFSIQIERAAVAESVALLDQEQRMAPRRSEVGVAPEVTWNVGGPCDHLDTWVGLSFLELLAIAVQSTANAQKPEIGGAGHVNARHGWGWPC